jgi:hypothetical protein
VADDAAVVVAAAADAAAADADADADAADVEEELDADVAHDTTPVVVHADGEVVRANPNAAGTLRHTDSQTSAVRGSAEGVENTTTILEGDTRIQDAGAAEAAGTSKDVDAAVDSLTDALTAEACYAMGTVDDRTRTDAGTAVDAASTDDPAMAVAGTHTMSRPFHCLTLLPSTNLNVPSTSEWRGLFRASWMLLVGSMHFHSTRGSNTVGPRE